jgi:hypothetical protein
MAEIHDATEKARRLVLCFDGTDNKFSGDETDTNIVKIYELLNRECPEQYHYYQRQSILLFPLFRQIKCHSCENLSIPKKLRFGTDVNLTQLESGLTSQASSKTRQQGVSSNTETLCSAHISSTT